MLKNQKKELVKDLTEELKGASSVVLVEYQGLDMQKQGELRSQLREVGARMAVVKNTLTKLAGTNAGLSKEAFTDEVLSGPTAIVITQDDPIAPLQVLGKFAKEHDMPSMKVGVVENIFQDASALVKLSNLPSKDVLASQVIGALMAPSYTLIGVLNTNLQKLIYVLKEASQKEA